MHFYSWKDRGEIGGNFLRIGIPHRSVENSVGKVEKM